MIYGYGRVSTKGQAKDGNSLEAQEFDLDDEEFMKIANTPFKYIGALGEYESKYLLVDKNYSLEDVNTIVKLFDYVTNTSQIITIFVLLWFFGTKAS